MHGVHRNWVKGTWFVQPTQVDIDVLPAIDTSQWKPETAREHAAEVHAILAAALRDDQKPLAGTPAVSEKSEKAERAEKNERAEKDEAAAA